VLAVGAAVNEAYGAHSQAGALSAEHVSLLYVPLSSLPNFPNDEIAPMGSDPPGVSGVMTGGASPLGAPVPARSQGDSGIHPGAGRSVQLRKRAALARHVLRLAAVTLITGVLSDQYVALISDMRVTRLAGGRIVSQEDTDIKLIALGGQFLMGFTGLARISGLRVEAWLGRVLKGVPVENYFQVLRREIEKAFVQEGQAGKMPHAFLAVGYMTDRPGGRVRPFSITISNSFDSAGTFSPDAAVSQQFGISLDTLGNQRQLLTSAGYPMRDTTRRALEQRIRVLVRGDPANPRLTVWPLLMALRDTARRSHGYVGTTALFASMPRCALPDSGISSGQGVDYRTQAASVYLPDAARGPADGAFRMPATISPAMHLYGFEVHARTLSPEEIRARAADKSYGSSDRPGH
jgi:hypothetical protein